MKFFFRTLGCKMNWLDSAKISAALINAGHKQTKDITTAETVFVNSCTVTSVANAKSLHTAKQALKSRKQVIAFGCATKIELEAWQKKLPQALVFQKKSDLLQYFGAKLNEDIFPATNRTRLPIAIQTGCDNFCTFCITRIARGSHRNFTTTNIIKQIKHAEDLGIKEIVLTGINIGAWGCKNSNKPKESRFTELLEIILRKTKIPRIRLSSLGPQFLDQQFFDVFANLRICDYLHLSVQSGSDALLKKMNRPYGSNEITKIVQSVRSRPNTAITGDFIVGFPGETSTEFNKTIRLVKNLKFAKLHVFPFSPREGTPAAQFDNQVPENIKKNRAEKLRKIGDQLHRAFLKSQIGNQLEVLAEGDNTGLTTNYIKIQTPDLTAHTIKKIKLIRKIIVQ